MRQSSHLATPVSHGLRALSRVRVGFTIYELLITLTIIGVLVSAALVSYTRVKERAYVTAMESDLHNLAIAEEFYADSMAGYSGTAAQVSAFHTSTDVTPLAYASDSSSWTAIVRHAKSDIVCSLSAGTKGSNQIDASGKIFCSKDQPLAFSVSSTAPRNAEPVTFDASAFFNAMAFGTPVAAPSTIWARASSVLGVSDLRAADLSATPNASSIAVVAWEFGDGTVIVGTPQATSTVTHAYSGPGPFRVRAVAVLHSGVIFSGVRMLSPAVSGPSLPAPAAPFAQLSYAPHTVHVGDVITFDGRQSAPASGDAIAAYAWAFGDGASAAGDTAQYAFPTAGTRIVSLTVVGTQGGVGVAAQSIPVLETLGAAAPPGDVPAAIVTADPIPVAAFVAAPRAMSVGTAVTVDATTSAAVASYAWDFADFTSASGATSAHTFAAPGTYSITLTVTSLTGRTAAATQDVTVYPINHSPVAVLSLSATTVLVGQSIRADGTGSTDPDQGTAADSVAAYHWDFADGTALLGAQTSHAWAAAGTYPVTLTVMDTHGATGVTHATVTVRANLPPAAMATVTGLRITGEPLMFDATATRDPEGALASLMWSYGDGTQGGGIAGRHTYAAPGTYTVTLTATDSLGATGTWHTDLVIAADQPPVADFRAQPATLAPGDSVLLDASASHDPDDAIASYSWTVRGLAPRAGVLTGVRLTEAGPYAVTLVVTDAAGATGTTTQTLVVAADPTAAFSIASASTVAGRTVLVDASASSAAPGQALTSYAFDFGNGEREIGAIGRTQYAAPGTYPVRLTVTDARGRAAQVTHSVTVAANHAPTAQIALSSRTPNVGALLTADGAGSRDADGSIVSYAWAWGGSRATGPTLQLVVPDTALTVSLTVTDDVGATGTAETLVTPNAAPVARIAIDGRPVSALATVAGRALTLDARMSNDRDGTVVSYGWSTTDGQGLAGASVVPYRVSRVGTDTITLRVTDDRGAQGTAALVLVAAANVAPTVDFTSTPVLPTPGLATQFVAQASDADGQVIGYAWDFGDFVASTEAAPAHAFRVSGSYSVQLRVTDDAGATAAVTHLVVVNQPPVARFTVNGIDPTTDSVHVTTGHRSVFNGTVSTDIDGGVSAYLWAFGDSAVSTESAPVHAYSLAGVYRVALQVTDNRGATAATAGVVHVTTNILPTATFTWAAATPLPGQAVTFTSLASDQDGTIQSYDWDDFTDDTHTPVAVHTFTAPGSYVVRLTVTDDSWGSTTVSQTVLVVGPPSPAISVNNGPTASTTASVGQGRLTTVDGSSSTPQDGTIAAYTWTWGDGSRDTTAMRATHRFQAAGTDTLRLAVTDMRGGVGTAFKVVTVSQNTAPTARITSATTTPVVGSSVMLDGSASTDEDGAIAAYSWSLNGQAAGTASTALVSVSSAAPRVAGLVVTDDAGATGTAALTLTPNVPPVARLTVSSASPVVGQSVTLDGAGSTDADGRIASYAWSVDSTAAAGVAPIAAGVQATIRPQTSGPLTIHLQVTDEHGATGTASRVVTVSANTAPVASFTVQPAQPVVGSPVTVTSTSTDAEGNVASYSWDFADFSTVAGGPSAAHTYLSPGSYAVRLSVTDAGGLVGTTTRSVVVDAPPMASFTIAPAVPTVGGTVVLTSTSADADGTIASYAWTFGDMAPTTSAVSRTYAQAGTYSVSLSVVDNLGVTSAAATQTVVVLQPPTAVAHGPATVAPSTLASFDGSASTPGSTQLRAFVWTYGDGARDSSAAATHTHAFTSVGIYTVGLRVIDSAGVASTASTTVTVDSPPVAAMTAPTSLVAGAAGAFTSTSTDPDAGQTASLTCRWTWGDGAADATTCAATHAFASAGSYPVVLRVTDAFGLSATATRTVPATAAPTGGMLFRLRADAGLTFSGSAVSTWGAIQGSLMPYTSQASNSAVTVRTGANGMPYVSLPPGGGILLTHNQAFGAQPGTTMALYVGIPSSRTAGYLTGRKHGNNDGEGSLYWGGDTQSSIIMSPTLSASGTSVSRGMTGCLISRFGGGTMDIGSLQHEPQAVSYTGTWQVGVANGHSEVLNGADDHSWAASALDVYEVIWYDHLLTPSEREALAQYFQARYGNCGP